MKANKTTILNVNSRVLKRTEPQQRSSTSIPASVAIIDLTEDSDTEQQSFSDGETQGFSFSLSSKEVMHFC